MGGRAGGSLPTHQRRPGLAAAALAFIFGLSVLGAYEYQHAGAKSPLVVMVHPVAEGHAISRADVSTVAVAGPVTAVRGADLDSVVGQRAATRLMPNMLVQRSMLTTADALSSGQAQVGVAVGSGQIPSDGLDAERRTCRFR
jgi:flagella basal body P-ring formation protein FlgA